MQGVKESMYDAYALKLDNPDIDLNDEIVESALMKKTPIVKIMEQQLQHLIKWVGHDQRRNDGVRARFANDEDDDIDSMFKDILNKIDNDPTRPDSDVPF